MKIYIFSEINYNDNKHINQYLFDYLTEKEDDCYFVERVTMKFPKLQHFISLFKKNKAVNKDKTKIIKCRILPPLRVFKILNYFLLKKANLILNESDIIISFVPHSHVYDIAGNKAKKIYYCVHDSQKQNYPINIIPYEKKLANKSIFFCDNETVMKNITTNYHLSYDERREKNISDYKAFLVPPPVPDEFFKINKDQEIKYNFVYYGSFHPHIDIGLIKQLSKRYTILIISNNPPSDLKRNNNITILKSIYDMEELANKINSAENILLPYDNSYFMSTITPAKALQVKSFGKGVYCSNICISKKYKFSTQLKKLKPTEKITQDYSVSNICDFLYDIISQKNN
ncbi:hypothetical protein EAE91_05665 [Photorhabdus noenieputensis]|uniref:hypothetical protein n=1 Tax=Photorhabdus noenieputensis TaxID=1208607 RepID=UPI001BD471B6|nr:hypothetical protein [Photorhabdus noenieputensis]MBS9436683.1 hypothetical protein [Photorhabdus noenieputensis]MCK3669459.1 hypothetical protein [Photorhabdus noenieputensis]